LNTATVNIASYLPAMAAAQPDALAVAFPLGRDRAGRQRYLRWTYQQLEDESNTIARGLAAIGITRGMHTVLMVKPSPDFFACVFALFKMGAVMIGIDPGMGIKNLKTCLAEAQPEAFIGIRKAHIARQLFGWAKATNRINVLVGRKLLPFGKTVTLNQVRARGLSEQGWHGQAAALGGLPVADRPGANTRANRGGPPPARATLEAAEGAALPLRGVLVNTRPDETAAILFTSGSTGVPKGVVYSHVNFIAQVRALRDCYNIQPGEIDLCTFPLFALYAPAMGMSAIVPEMDFTKPGNVDPRNIVEPILEFNVTNMFGSPALLKRLVEDPPARELKLPCLGSLKRVISAGAPVPSRTIARIKELLPPTAQVFTPYGATECLPVASIGSDEILGETAALTDQGKGVCVGRPAADIEVKIIRISDDPIAHWSHDLELTRGEIGEIIVRGPQVTRSYFNRDHSTKLAKIHLNAGTFFHRMGDLGYFDEKGRVWFCGRKSERVKAKDRTYFTAMCEGVFDALRRKWPDTPVNPEMMHFRTALVGVRMATGIVPVVCVEQGMTIGDRKALSDVHANQLVAQANLFEVTKNIDRFLAWPVAFPTDIRHNSKINRPLLAQWAAKQLGGRPA